MSTDQIVASWHLIFIAAQRLRDYGMLDGAHSEKFTIAQEKLLGVVFSHAEGIMLKDLARELELTPGAVSQSVDTLVKEGLMERGPAPHDRRAVIIRPSEKCRHQRGLIMEKFNRVMESVFDEVTPTERCSFVNILEKVVAKTKDSRTASIRRTKTVVPFAEEMK